MKDQELNIQWFPGHMTKARRMMQDNLSSVDALCEILDARIPNASRNPEIDALCDRLVDWEHTADNIYSNYMSNLFKEEKDAIELVKKKNIIQTLEDTCDLGKKISDTVRNILVKMG